MPLPCDYDREPDSVSCADEPRARAPRDLIIKKLQHSTDERIIELWEAVDQCRVDQMNLLRAHRDFREEVSTKFDLLMAQCDGMSRLHRSLPVGHMQAQGMNEHTNKDQYCEERSDECYHLGCNKQGVAVDVSQKRKVSGALNSVMSPAREIRANETDDVAVDNWNFRHSCWDGAIFLGHEGIFELPEAIANASLFVINLVVQVFFVMIVFNIATSSLDDDTIEGYRKWRTNTGHSVQYMDQLTERSLAARVCSGDPSLHLSDTQSSQVDMISKYLRENTPFNGPMMCILALLTWLFTVTRELHVIKDMVSACLYIPRERTMFVAKEGGLELRSIGHCRLWLILFLAALRSGIAGALLIIGIKYLIVTISIEEILLNAVALEFILNVDELIFEVLAPKKTRRFLLLINPIPMTHVRAWKGLDSDFAFALFVTVAVLSVCIPLWLIPEIRSMNEAENELCGGFIDFSYSLLSVKVVAWAEEIGNPDEAWERLQGTSRYNIVRRVIEGEGFQDGWALSFRAPIGISGPGWSVNSMGSWDLVETGDEFNSECTDRGLLAFPTAIASMRDTVGNQSITSCKDVSEFCSRFDYASIRLFCPETCACTAPNSSLSLPFPVDGCPSSCFHQPEYVSLLRQSPCNDTSKDVLVASPTWVSLAQNLILAASSFGSYSDLFIKSANLMLIHGCDAVSLASVDLCYGGSLKTLQYWCPVACACAMRQRDTYNQCPSSC